MHVRAVQLFQSVNLLQARAPNSPVIIVGTHLDLIDDKYPPNYLKDMCRLIEEKYMSSNG